MPIDHELIRRNGWRQGAIFSPESTAEIIDGANDGSRLIVVSHDCDIVHRGDQEPHVEVCVADPLTNGVDGQFRWARHPRRLDVNLEISDGAAGYRLEAFNRKQFNQSILEQYEPDAQAVCPPEELTRITVWLAKRYTRAALPDTFNARQEPARDRIRNILRRNSEIMSSIQIALEPKAELGQDEQYRVHIIALMLKDDYDTENLRIQIEEAINQIARALHECDGIEVVEAAVVSEDSFTLHASRFFVELNFDDLSLRAVPEHPRLPDAGSECP